MSQYVSLVQCTGVIYENVMSRIYYYFITDLFIIFTCSLADIFAINKEYMFNGKQIVQYHRGFMHIKYTFGSVPKQVIFVISRT